MATVSYPPFYTQQILDADGKPVAGGRVLSFYAGTDAPLAMFTPDGVPLGSSVSIAADGSALFCLKVGTAYKLVCVDSQGATVWMRDNVRAGGGGGGGGGLPPAGAENALLQSDGTAPEWRRDATIAGTMRIANGDGESTALSVEAGSISADDGNIYAKGNIRSSHGDLRCLGNIESQEGNITASEGNVTAGGTVTGVNGIVSRGAGSFNFGVVIGSAGAPSSPVVGQVYYNTTDEKLYCYDGSQWNEVGGGGGVDTFVKWTQEFVGATGTTAMSTAQSFVLKCYADVDMVPEEVALPCDHQYSNTTYKAFIVVGTETFDSSTVSFSGSVTITSPSSTPPRVAHIPLTGKNGFTKIEAGSTYFLVFGKSSGGTSEYFKQDYGVNLYHARTYAGAITETPNWAWNNASAQTGLPIVGLKYKRA